MTAISDRERHWDRIPANVLRQYHDGEYIEILTALNIYPGRFFRKSTHYRVWVYIGNTPFRNPASSDYMLITFDVRSVTTLVCTVGEYIDGKLEREAVYPIRHKNHGSGTLRQLRVFWPEFRRLMEMNYAGLRRIVRDLRTSQKGIEWIADFEMSEGFLRSRRLGEFSVQDELLGIYPHYVFKLSGGRWVSDGGITLGYGHWVNQSKYRQSTISKTAKDKYAPNAPFVPSSIPANGRPYRVPGSLLMPIREARDLFAEDLKDAEDAVNIFLNRHDVVLNQHQFDTLISFTHNYGTNWWTRVPERVLPEFIREGNGSYDAEEVRAVFARHPDNPGRRMLEAELFITGVYGRL
jgi:GH24 family phage-related lysozyme (muramidase)